MLPLPDAVRQAQRATWSVRTAAATGDVLLAQKIALETWSGGCICWQTRSAVRASIRGLDVSSVKKPGRVVAKEHNGGFVAYYRVWADRQGRGGLGRDAQVAAVRAYLNGGNWHLVGEFEEIESGRRNARPELDRALKLAELHRAPLVIAKVDRLTRSVAFLERLLDSDVEILFCDVPKIEGPSGRFLLRWMASVAKVQADLVSARTKSALAAFKERESKKPEGRRRRLGGRRRTRLTDGARASDRKGVAECAHQRAANAADTIRAIQAAGATTLQAIADELNRRGIATAAAHGEWQPVQVQRVLRRIAAIARQSNFT
jgi:DNA invertase Pin-like site-specific DNA recombinase